MLMLALGLVLWIAVPQQDVCTFCGGDGLVTCRRHGRAATKPGAKLEEGVLHCSDIIECPDCGGTMLMRCSHCRTAPPAAWSRERTEHAAWLEKMRAIDRFLETPLHHLETAHFILTFNVNRLPIGRRGMGPHDGMHLYARRLEEFYVRFCKDLGATDADFLAKTHVMIFDSDKIHARAALEYTRQGSRTASKLMGRAPVFTIYNDRSRLHEEPELYQAVIHHVAHCLLSNVWDGLWPGKRLGGWLDAGLAHYYEIDMFGGVRHYCWRETDTMSRFKFGKWESLVKSLVIEKRKQPVFPTLVKATDQLTPEEHALSWSIVDYLLAEHAGSLGEVARQVKQHKPLGAVYRAALQMSAAAVEEEWKDYVLRHYGRKKR